MGRGKHVRTRFVLKKEEGRSEYHKWTSELHASSRRQLRSEANGWDKTTGLTLSSSSFFSFSTCSPCLTKSTWDFWHVITALSASRSAFGKTALTSSLYVFGTACTVYSIHSGPLPSLPPSPWISSGPNNKCLLVLIEQGEAE